MCDNWRCARNKTVNQRRVPVNKFSDTYRRLFTHQFEMTSSLEKESQQPSQEIQALVLEGSRAFSLHDYETSTANLGQACELL
jgi:hypothetical protein